MTSPALTAAYRKALRVIRKGPSVLRNVVFARLGIWPVRRIDGSDLQTVPVYCISLRRAMGKRSLMEAQARGLGLQRFEFVDAVDASELLIDDLVASGAYDREKSVLYHEHGLTVNEVACSLSHARVYELIVRRGDACALIVEDDALFLPRAASRFRLADLPPGWDVVFLNSFRDPEQPNDVISGDICGVESYDGSAAAYLLSRAGAMKLAGVAAPVIHAADGLVGRCLALQEGHSHRFKQVGVGSSLTGYLLYPDAVLNGSTVHYHVSEVQNRCRK